MSLDEYISDPRFLQEYCISEDLSQLSMDPKSVPHSRQIRLGLFHPLGKPDIFKSCCRYEGRHPPYPGMVFTVRDRQEILNLQPLAKIWRQELCKVPPFSRVIFDLTLPPNCRDRGIEWYSFGRPKSWHGIDTTEAFNLVRTIALTTRMRVKGDVSFQIIHDQTDLKAMKEIEQHVSALNRATSTEMPEGEDVSMD
ncbi:hypothetical protein BO94DRAFT_267215 [Aspergillus sclerotioniger CBS 115572]|uniref:Uncharacterized protein n=1 Tax=Aspergillus sclerotioniger CBS 115572 TaxID=1450535 RepID=A0A317VC92_9EURO|nr:hypothetical protein BO94DRAFT_267215 [Aspergillus sclerotioniger CBS 115572]PWY70861.1 hypothetical protein BO94DRAFT_267215 [Aspergillus sclerotioniger CBS 115572]